MSANRRLLWCLCVAVPALVLIGLQARAVPDAVSPSRPVLLELFTSQSCSSCPPADAFLGELAQRSDVLPLSFHVDYWNGLGWTDRFSSPQFTDRQRAYAAALPGSVYTPQLVIDGARDAVGSDRSAINRAISLAKQNQQNVPLKLERHGANLDAHFSDPDAFPDGAVMLLITFDPVVTQSIGGGENSGRTVTYHNVVRSMRVLHDHPSATVSDVLRPEESGARVALIIQEAPGKIIGVAATP